jgi:hypothetical protein
MNRRAIILAILSFIVASFAVMMFVGCGGSDGPFATPLYIHQGDDPNAPPERYVMGIAVVPGGVNIAIGGVQQFKAIATFNDATTEDLTGTVEWYTENPAVGKFEIQGGKFLAQKPGTAIIRCRLKLADTYIVSQASWLNSFDPNQDIPPAVPLNPMVEDTPEGVVVSWSMNVTDGDMAGYNIWRTQVSAAHYASDFGKVNDSLILNPPFLDKTVVSGWYYYRVTAEDLLGLNSAPSEEVAVFVAGNSHYGTGYDANTVTDEHGAYKDAFSTAF